MTALQGLRELPTQNSEMEFGPQVVLIYENLDVGLRAVKLLGAITRSANVDDTQLSTWRFDHLQSSEVRKTASARARMADIVIVALQSGHGFAAHVRSWFDEWIRSRKALEGALVVVFEPQPGDTMEFRPSGTTSLLQAIAITAGMDYFSNAPAPEPNHHDPGNRIDWIAERPSLPRWGLNE